MSAVAKRKVYVLDGSNSSLMVDSFRIDVTNVGKEDIRSMLIDIIGNETATQINLGNPPSITFVDDSKSKPVSAVNKKIIVLFGTQLPVSALKIIERLLISNIQNSTDSVTGALSDINNWEWRHIRNGRQIPITGPTISFGPRDFIVLRPKLAYASAVNKRVASGSRAMDYHALNTRKGRKTAKRNQKLGFMAMTARQTRGFAEFVPFSVTVGMTSAFKVPGEVRKIGGTAYLLIAPRRKGYRR